MKLIVVVLCAICAPTFAKNDSSNQPPEEILPVVLPPDGPQLLWHAFQSFIANANPDRPLENLIAAGQNPGNCGSTSTTSQTPEVTTQSRKKGKSHATKKHAKYRSGGKNHKHDKKQAHH